MAIPFNLEAFKAGQKALTRDRRLATFVGFCEECDGFRSLVYSAYSEDSFRTSLVTTSKDGLFLNYGQNSKYDLVSMVSRHQHLIDSYDPEDTWQFLQLDYWASYHQGVEPEWNENSNYRLHPHNDLIKAWKKGAKIQVSKNEQYWHDNENPEWNEKLHYRIKPEYEFTYPIYKKNKETGDLFRFTALTVARRLFFNNEYGVEYDSHTEHTSDIWQDWTPPEDTPQTKTVYEWMCRAESGNWIVQNKLLTEDQATNECWIEYRKTGRSWEVEV